MVCGVRADSLQQSWPRSRRIRWGAHDHFAGLGDLRADEMKRNAGVKWNGAVGDYQVRRRVMAEQCRTLGASEPPGNQGARKCGGE